MRTSISLVSASAAFVAALLVACGGSSSDAGSVGQQTAGDGEALTCGSATSSSPCNDSGGPCTALPPTCPTSCASLGTVTFHLSLPAGAAGDGYTAAAYTWGLDAVNWFSVTTAAGAPVQVVPPTSDQGPGLEWAPSCSACESLTIGAGFSSPAISGGGISGTWNGTAYSTTSTCNSAQSGTVPCGDVLCSPAGNYVVTMCASAPGATTSECVSVPFVFPGTSDVSGSLGP